MATLINIGNNIKVNPKFISYFEGLEIVLANKHRFTVTADVIELVKAYVENRNTGALHYKGKVSSVSNLPSTGNIDGDMYLVTGEDKYYAWNGTSWDETPTIVNISSFETSLAAEAYARQQADATLQSAIAAEATRAAGKEAELEQGVATLNVEVTGELLAHTFEGFTVGSSWPSKKVAFQFIEGHTYAIKILQTGTDKTYLSLRDNFNTKHAEEKPHSSVSERTWTVTVPANSACEWLYCTVESVTEEDTIAVSVVDTANKGVVDSVNTLANAVTSNTSDIADTIRYLDKPTPSSSTNIEDIEDMPNKVEYSNAKRARVYDNAAISGTDFRLTFEFDSTSGLRYSVVISETKGSLDSPNVSDTGWKTQNADIPMRPEWVGKYLQIRFSHLDDSTITLSEVYNAVSNFSYKSYVDTSATLTDNINLIIDERENSEEILSLNPEKLYKNIFIQLNRRKQSGGTETLGNEQLVLVHFSDVHGSTANLARIITFCEQYSPYIDNVLHTGDTIQQYYSQSLDWWTNTAGSEKILNCIGNHDTWDNDGTWQPAHAGLDCYNKFFAPFISNWDVTQPSGASTGKCYYYKDYTAKGVRLIVIDCMSFPNDTDQQSWLDSTLESARLATLAVVVATHSQPYNTTRISCNFSSVHRADVQENIGGTGIPQRVQSFIDAGGEFVCYLTGHAHRDRLSYLTDYPSQICITIDAARTQDGYMDKVRTVGAKSQDLFNIVSIDTSDKVIRLCRVGADIDRYLRHSGMLCIRYTDKEVLFSF